MGRADYSTDNLQCPVLEGLLLRGFLWKPEGSVAHVGQYLGGWGVRGAAANVSVRTSILGGAGVPSTNHIHWGCIA